MSPATGSRVAKKKAADALFACGAMGDGSAIRVTGSTLYAPLDARIEAIPETGYEIMLRSAAGLKLWIRIGASTHHLMGEKCQRLVCVGDEVAAGSPLMNINPIWLKSKGIEPICMVTVRNTKSLRALVPANNMRLVALEDPLYDVYW
ncbi:PTS glucose transporter subunit IIA [Alteromonas ponticola]|uniref:PTS system glucose-specific EIIA component n=1 Tax=Alteromonas aquimaris TaxID=2998417 RepID=A0ABT3P7R9_9ALTE|nr:PTS glucose transporter subunit IIA [Alteromonas aquimaris]MCW8108797.1 PTS glucose transporter subunit IIA [Alteromonas aquimaris]